MGTEKNYCVYKHTFPNGKTYIGITRTNPLYRWGHKGKGYRSQPLMWNAILKYGWDNIKHDILFADLSKEEAEQKEIELISLYKSNKGEYGYNIENGGKCVGTLTPAIIEKMANANKGKKRSDDTKKRISEALKGRPKSEAQKIKQSNAMKGKRHTEEWKMQNSIRQKGRKHSEQARKKISEAKKGSNNPMYGKHMTEEAKEKKRKHSKRILQYDGNGNFIKEWDSAYSISKELGINTSNIRRSCTSRYLKAKGFKFEYSNS